MTVPRLALLPFAFLMACATAPPPGSYGAWVRLSMLQRAGAYPSEWTVPGDSHAAQLATLERWTEAQGYILAPAGIGRKNLLGHVSYSQSTGWVILVNRDEPVNTRFYTLLHELGHIYSPPKLSIEADEIFAEMVATQVCAHVGLDAAGQTASYLVERAALIDQERFVAAHEKQIDAVVAKLTKAVTER